MVQFIAFDYNIADAYMILHKPGFLGSLLVTLMWHNNQPKNFETGNFVPRTLYKPYFFLHMSEYKHLTYYNQH